MKRIALVVPAFPKLSETFIVNKFLGLRERGWDIHMVCDQSDSGEWEKFPDLQKSAHIHRQIHMSWPSQPRWLAALLMPWVLTWVLARNFGTTCRYLYHGWKKFGWNILRHLYFDAAFLKLRPSLVHWEFGSLAIGRMHLQEILGCKSVVGFRGYDLNFVGLDNPGYYQEVWDKADALHLLGEDLWRRSQKRGCPQDKPHALIPPAIDSQKFDPGERMHLAETGTRERPLRILSVGRLEWKKGYEFALEALKAVVDQGINCEYRILGGGEYLEAVAYARYQLGLDDAVQILGPRPHDQVKEQMLWADVFLHAAVSEGFCNAVLEAQSMRLPVVCTDADGLSENVVHGETGFVVPRRHPEAMADKLVLLARDHALRQQMGQAGRQRVLMLFRLPDQISAFEAFYQQVLKD